LEEQDQPTKAVESDQAKPRGRKAGVRKAGAGRKSTNPKPRGAAAKREAARQERADIAQAQAKLDEARAMAVKPVARPARMRRRHWGVILSFLMFVLAPTVTTYWYLEERAADQYASTIGFAVRKEDNTSASDLLGGLIGGGSSSSNDTDILYEFIQSQKIVEMVDGRLDLRKIYSKPKNDPYFAFDPGGSIEDLVAYWGRMVKVFYDRGSGLIKVRVQAFTAKDAQQIAQAIFEESSIMINRLNAIARQDATRYAQADLESAVEKLKAARQAVTAFRNEAQIVDPNEDIRAQMGLLKTMQEQLAGALIKLDLLSDTTRVTDPRVEQATRRITVIKARIAEERKKFGSNDTGEDYAKLINEYEGLTVEREFAERSYLSALTAFGSAKAEGLRKSRYLAAYVEPTLAETPQYPERWTLLGLVSMFLLIIWSIIVLVYYSVKDRR